MCQKHVSLNFYSFLAHAVSEHSAAATFFAPILRLPRGVVVNALVVINKVALRRARLVLGWVTVCGQVNHLGM